MKKSGAWYSYKGEKIGQGRENAKIFLREHPDVMQDVENQVREFYHLPKDEVPGQDKKPQKDGQPSE